MFFLAIGSLLGTVTAAWFTMMYKQQNSGYTNAQLKTMAQGQRRDSREFIRKRKLVVTIDEILALDPTFQPPLVPSKGEPDI